MKKYLLICESYFGKTYGKEKAKIIIFIEKKIFLSEILFIFRHQI